MTEENARRAYDYFVRIGETAKAKNILIRHPEFQAKPEVEQTKRKGGK